MRGDEAPGAVLAADIGGTRARFAIAQGGELRDLAELAVADFFDPALALAAFLDRCGRPVVRGAVLAIAAPVGEGENEEPVLTNGTWRFRRGDLARVLDLPVGGVKLVNDFLALAAVLPVLTDKNTRPVGGGAASALAGAAMAVLGPGTGLGVAGLVRGHGGWVAIAGEGGHATLAPGDERESAILDLARRRFGHVSAERLLSGSGLPLLHQLRVEVEGGRVDAGGSFDTPALVTGALAGDVDCLRTSDLFCSWLGSVSGNVALSFGARGGVFLGGGILPRLGELIDRSAFRARFEAKGRLNGYLAAVPTRVILCPESTLRGAARLAEEALAGEGAQ